jgi:hypothetical protein
MRGRTDVVLPIGAVTGTGDGNRLSAAERQDNTWTGPPAPRRTQASNATRLPRCVVAL